MTDSPARQCLWCVPGLPDEVYDNADPELMCVGHLAEWEGLPVIELERMLREQWEDQR